MSSDNEWWKDVNFQPNGPLKLKDNTMNEFWYLDLNMKVLTTLVLFKTTILCEPLLSIKINYITNQNREKTGNDWICDYKIFLYL